MPRLMNTDGSASKIADIFILLIMREIRCSENCEYISILRVCQNIKGDSLLGQIKISSRFQNVRIYHVMNRSLPHDKGKCFGQKFQFFPPPETKTCQFLPWFFLLASVKICMASSIGTKRQNFLFPAQNCAKNGAMRQNFSLFCMKLFKKC